MSRRKPRNLKQSTNSNTTIIKGNKTLDDILAMERYVEAEKQLHIRNALGGNDIPSLIKAQDYLKLTQKENSGTSIKSLLVDPLNVSSSFGYKDKPYQLSYDMLRAMSKTHVIRAIIQTRKAQVKAYSEPQSDKHSSTGFVIDKRNKWSNTAKDKKLSKADSKKAEEITQFILDCGTKENFWNADSFDKFLDKIVEDSLTLDQATFEVRRDRLNRPIEFFAVDGSTFRIADSYADESANDAEEINGYKPYYVQVIQGRVYNYFYPWELCFGVRNASTDIRLNGYGKSELEDLVQLITAILNADTYNANFFKVGSNPKGIITYSGNINQSTVDEFRAGWQAQVSGAANAHKTPIVNADKVNWIPTHVPNKDMEFGKYQEFLIKAGCAVYTIDPSEIGFPMSGAADGKGGLGGEDNKEKLKYSKDKGLRPILKNIAAWMNKYIVWQLDPEFEFRFVGDDDYEDKESELEADIKRVTNYMTVNEIREKNNLDPVEGMDIILNPVASQATMMAMQGNPDSNGAVDGMQDDENPDSNPFMKSLQDDINRLLS